MRDLMMAGFLTILVPLAFANPFIAFVLWGWTALSIPTNYLYGFLSGARFNLFFAILTLAFIAFGRIRGVSYPVSRTAKLLLIFVLHGTLCAALAYANNPFNAYYYEVFLKVMVFCLVMPLFVQSRLRIHVMVIVIVLGLGFHGIVDGLKVAASAGGHIIKGVKGSMLGDNNHLGTALALLIPLSYYLYLQSAKALAKYAFLGVLALTALTVMGSRSRGAFVAMAVTALWLILTSRRKVIASAVVVAGVVGFLLFAPADWLARYQSIENAADDTSFIGRVIAWKISSSIALNNPVFGGGFHAVQVQYIWDMFKTSQGVLGFIDTPVPEFSAKAAHSVYFEIMGDLGFVGLFMFLAIMGNALITRFEVKRIAVALGRDYIWARDLGDMLMLAVIAYLVGGGLVSLGYLEVIYMIVMLMELLKQHLLRETRRSGHTVAAVSSDRLASMRIP